MITATITPRIDDLGPAGHVHNTVAPAWFQEARYELLEKFADPTAVQPFPLMIKEYTVTFHREIFLTPKIEVTIGVERIGNSSFVLHETARQDGHTVAVSQVVYIYIGADNRPSSIPEHLRQHLVTLHI